MELYVPQLETTHDKKCIHVIYHGSLPWIRMDEEDILKDLDRESELVRQLMRQVTTYDFSTQTIVALIVDRQTVLSEVIRI